MTKEQALDRVASLSRKIDKSEMSLDAWKWARAEAMAAAADLGATQQAIGIAAGMGQESARRHIKIGTTYRSNPTRPTYSVAFDEVTGFDRDAAQDRTDLARTKRTLETASGERTREIVESLPPKAVAILTKALAVRAAPNIIHKPNTDRTFIDLVVRANSSLIELESLVRSWSGPNAIPTEFSSASFDDIAEKAMRIKDTVNALRGADNDEFQRIIENMKVVDDVA